jgi:hypothetical protein
MFEGSVHDGGALVDFIIRDHPGGTHNNITRIFRLARSPASATESLDSYRGES